MVPLSGLVVEFVRNLGAKCVLKENAFVVESVRNLDVKCDDQGSASTFCS